MAPPRPRPHPHPHHPQAVSNLPRRIGFHELLRSTASTAVEEAEEAQSPCKTDAAAIVETALPLGQPLLLQSILAQRTDPPSVKTISALLAHPWEGPYPGYMQGYAADESLKPKKEFKPYKTLLEAVLAAAGLPNVKGITRENNGQYTLREGGELLQYTGAEAQQNPNTVSWKRAPCMYGEPLTRKQFSGLFEMLTRGAIDSFKNKTASARVSLDPSLGLYHDPASEGNSRQVKLETPHPYPTPNDANYVLEIPGATAMNVWFDGRTATQETYHFVRFLRHEGATKFYGKARYSGDLSQDSGKWPTKSDPLRIPAGRCVVNWKTDDWGSGQWGWALTAEAAPDESGSNSRFVFPLEVS